MRIDSRAELGTEQPFNGVAVEAGLSSRSQLKYIDQKA